MGFPRSMSLLLPRRILCCSPCIAIAAGAVRSFRLSVHLLVPILGLRHPPPPLTVLRSIMAGAGNGGSAGLMYLSCVLSVRVPRPSVRRTYDFFNAMCMQLCA